MINPSRPRKTFSVILAMMAEHKCIIWFSPRIVWMLALFLGANKEVIPISAEPPNLGGSVVVDAVETTTATAKWTKPTAGTFTNYTITVTPDESGVAAPTVTPTTVQSSEASPSVALSGLVAGQVYTVSVQTNWNNVQGQAMTEKFRTKPLQVTNIVVTTPTTTTATVTWTALTLAAKFNSLYRYQVDIVQPGPTVSPNEVQHPGTTTGVTGLTPGTSYNVTVKTIAGTGLLVTESDPAVQVFIAKPTPVTQGSIAFINVGTTAADATWNKVSVGVFTSYKVSLSPSGPTLTPSPVPGSTDPPKTSFTNLVPGTKYTFTVTTVSGTVDSDTASKTFTAKPVSVDLSKVGITAITTNSASVSWPKITEGLVTSYTVTIDESGTVTPPNVTSLENPSVQLTGLTAGTKYIITFVTNSGDGKSVSVTKEFYTKADQVTGMLVETVDTTTATITWKKVAPGRVDNYNITVSPSGATITPSTVSGSEQNPRTSLSQLKAGVNYTIEIISIAGSQTTTATKSFWTKPFPVLESTIGVANVTRESATVSWGQVVDGEFEHYLVSISPTGPTVIPTRIEKNETSPSSMINGLSPGGEYTVTVVTVAGDEESEGVSVKFRTIPIAVDVDSIVIDNDATNSANVTWGMVNGTFEMYTITVSPPGPMVNPSAVNSGDAAFSRLTNLMPGALYNVTIVTVAGDQSASTSTSFRTKPLPVTGVTLTPNGSKMTISWTAGVGSTQSSYKVRYHAVFKNSSSQWKEASVNHPALKTEISITPGEKYEVEVIAISGDQSSDAAPKNLVTAPFPPASASVNNSAATTTSIEVKWTAPSTNSYFIKYVIKYTKQGQGSKEVTATNTELKKTITGLEAGVKYTVNVFTESNENKRSNTSADTVGTAKPNCDVKMTDLSTETTKLKANYSESSFVFTSYRFVISNGPAPKSREVPKANSPRILEYTQGVQPGAKYTVKASCVSNSVQSDVKDYFLASVPAPVTTVDLVSVSFNYVKMTLHRPAGTFNSVEIKCSGPLKGQQNGCTFPKSIFNFIDSTYNVTYDKLDSHENYTITITVTSNGKQSSPKVVKAKTSHGRPGPVDTFIVTSETPTRAKLVWTTPDYPNGLVSTYVVTYTGTYTKNPALNLPIHKDNVTYNVNPQSGSYTQFLDRLKGGYHYDFIIYGQTDYPGPGENVGQSVTMKTAAPTLLAGATTPAKTSTEPTETTIKMKFKVSFNESNGPILYYSIIGRENLEGGALKTQSMDESSIQRWKQVKNKTDEWPAYFAIHQCKIFSEPTTCESKPSVSRKKRSTTPDSVEVTIGIQDCKNVAGYCNGALKAGAYFQFSLRGYTGPDKYQDTVFSERILTSTSGLPVGIIVGGVSAVLVAIIIGVVVITVVVIKKRKANKEGAESSQGQGVPVTNPTFSECQSDIYDELTIPVPPVPKQVEPPVMAMVTRYLPDASNVTREKLQRIFTKLGVKKIQDMTFLKEKDIIPPLMVIEARRFLDQIQEQEERGGYDEGVYVEAAADPQQVQHDIYNSNVPVPAGGTVPHRGNEALYVNIGGGTNNAAGSNNQENAYASLDQADMKADAGVYEKLGKGRKK